MRIVDGILNHSDDLISFSDFSNDYYTYHESRWKNYFDEARNNLTALLLGKTANQQNFIRGLVTNFETIIKATPNQIPRLITEFTTGVYQTTLDDDTFRKEIETAFNYSGFRKSAKASWFAERFEVKACLYCNAQFTLVVGKDGTKKKLLFQLDHFYNKERLPFLSLTLGNLVPSCSSCNISKSKTEFTLATHIHPYNEDANIMFNFFIDENKALEYLLGNRDHKLLAPKINVIDPRFTTHSKIFNIDNIYNKHTDIVEELILKSLYYNKTKRDELKKEFNELNLSQSVIDRFVLGSYSLDSEINKRPLAKLSKDIGKQLKILK
jgi:hypothetical protein